MCTKHTFINKMRREINFLFIELIHEGRALDMIVVQACMSNKKKREIQDFRGINKFDPL